MKNSLDKLIYITMPKGFVLEAVPDFNPDIPLPVRLESDSSNFNTSEVTPEMILAGMLTVFAYDRNNKNIDYFRRMFNLWRPNIKAEMTEAAILKIKNGDFDIAEEILDSLEGLFPDDILTKLNYAMLMEDRAGKYESIGEHEKALLCIYKAFDLYKYLIGMEPPSKAVFFNAGLFYLSQKKYSGAKELLTTYLLLDNEQSGISEKRRVKAKKIISVIEKQYLDNELFAAALECIQNNDAESCMQKIHEFLQLYPTSWNGWFVLGWALRKLQRWQDAEAAFLKCLELFKNRDNQIPNAYSDICNELSICLMEMNRLKDAEDFLLKGMAAEPENIKFISNLGVIALKQKDYLKAKSFFKAALLINPDDKIAAELLKVCENS